MDRISKEKRSWNMSRIRSSDTALEIKIRRYLYSRNIRYRLSYPVSGKPDITFPRQRTAVFIDGCFWHMHGCSLSVIPKTSSEFWKNKLEKNRQRDETVTMELETQGWKVVRIWECEIEKNLESALAPLLGILISSRDR